MKIYTVTIDFEDRSRAIMQVAGRNEFDALKLAMRQTEALKEYDQSAIEQTLASFIRITQLAMGYKGVWLWNHANFKNAAVNDIYGGIIVQTDKNGPLRKPTAKQKAKKRLIEGQY